MPEWLRKNLLFCSKASLFQKKKRPIYWESGLSTGKPAGLPEKAADSIEILLFYWKNPPTQQETWALPQKPARIAYSVAEP